MTHCLLTLIFIIPLVFVYFLLLQVSGSDRNWFPAPTFRVFYFEILGFIASVRCVEWANCYFWVIIAAMFVCLRLLRDDLCLSLQTSQDQWSPAMQWFSFARVPATSAILFLSAEKRVSCWCDLMLVCVSQVSPGVWWWSQWVIGTTCYEMREGGHTLATIVYVWLVRPVLVVAGDQWLARGTEPHWVTTLRLLAIAAPARHIAGNGRPLPLAMPGTSSGQHSDCPAGVHTLTRHAQKICQWTVNCQVLLVEVKGVAQFKGQQLWWWKFRFETASILLKTLKLAKFACYESLR